MNSLPDPHASYTWIVVGGGIAGAALGYELSQVGFSVLVVDHARRALPGERPTSASATRYSYGGLANWAGTSPLTCDLCATGMARHRGLSQELGADTHFREIPLVMPIAPDADAAAVAATFAGVAQSPQWLSRAEACDLEPLLKAQAIGGAFVVTQGQVDPDRLTDAYLQAMGRQGGKVAIATVQGFVQASGRVAGVATSIGTWYGENVVICAGGWSRPLLKQLGVQVPLYFTHAEIVELPPAGVQLRTIVMAAPLARISLEMTASAAEREVVWEEPGQEVVPPVMDVGAVQFPDGTIRIGQLSRALSDPEARIDAAASEATIRTAVGQILPTLQALPGTWHHCLVAFSRDRLPLIGPVPGVEGLHVFTGFSTPLVVLPTLAQRYARQLAGTPDPWLPQMTPDRWVSADVGSR
ncbi:NAD(P)/FAD-dependent oxidoreductase [Trichothermofontia sp.]